MLHNAAPEQVARWTSVPEDGRWYTLEPPAYVANDAFEGASGWPHMDGGAKHWKACMAGPTSNFANLLRIFGVEPYCVLCSSGGGSGGFDAHATSPQHFRAVHEVVEHSYELAREELWHETYVVGGRARFNHLDGEVQVLREPPTEPVLEHARRPEDVVRPGVWVLARGPAAVPVKPVGSKEQWPNLWSLRHWKEKMDRPARRLAEVLEACNSSLDCRCMLCGIGLSPEHLLGPKHYGELMAKIPEHQPLRTDGFWQTWAFVNGAVAFNHVDGTVRLVRRPAQLEDVGLEQPAAPAGTAQDQVASGGPPPDGPAAADDALRDRVLAAAKVPTPVLSETLAANAAGAAAAPGHQAPASASPWGFQASRRATPDHAAGADGSGAKELAGWLWRRLAAEKAPLLDAALDAAGVPRGRACGLCGAEATEGLAEHLVFDPGHLREVQARLLAQGAEGQGWVQRWPRVEVHHLTLELTVGEDHRQGRPGCGQAAIPAREQEPQPPARVGGGGGGAPCPTNGEKERAPIWEAFVDPGTGTTWYYNHETGEASWVQPQLFKSLAPAQGMAGAMPPAMLCVGAAAAADKAAGEALRR